MSVAYSAITIGGAAIGAISANKASKRAASATRDATDMSVQEQRRQYDTTREDYAPYREAGIEANQQLMDPQKNFKTAPGYDWRRSEGQRGLENLFSAKGGGGNAMRALNEYNQQFASNEYGNWFGQTSSIADRGMGATGSTAQAGANAANANSAAYANQGNALANNAWNRHSGINSSIQGGIGNFLYMKGNQIGPWQQHQPFENNPGTPNGFEW